MKKNYFIYICNHRNYYTSTLRKIVQIYINENAIDHDCHCTWIRTKYTILPGVQSVNDIRAFLSPNNNMKSYHKCWALITVNFTRTLTERGDALRRKIHA